MVDKFAIENINFRSLRRRFESVNQARLDKVYATLRSNQQQFITLLPLLLHVNNPMLPGYSSNRTPCGISNYRPSETALDAANTYAKKFRITRTVIRDEILALYIMGSAGSLAFSQKSDLDIWICHHPQLDSEQLELLQTKANNIERWADSMDLEVHFFLVNADTFKQGTTEDLSSESSGSAQHILLLEEFYRASILLAGRHPVWWLVPPKLEADYDEFVEELIRKRFINAEEVIDFGSLGHPPAEEFFGAGIWHLSKGITSPFKSALKILLTEIYATSYPDVELLGMKFKRLIHDNEFTAEQLDPYLMLYQMLEDYLQGEDNSKRLEQARRAFYFKINAPLTEPVKAHEAWRYKKLNEMTQEWGWDKHKLAYLDSYNNWDITIVEQERKAIIEELTRSYKALSRFARQYADSNRISQYDLTILGRKLFAAFERKIGKVEVINRGISKHISEERITIHQAANNPNLLYLFRGRVAPEKIHEERPVKKFNRLTELLYWAHVNGVLNSNTQINYNVGDSQRVAEYIYEHYQTIVNDLESSFIFDPEFDDLSKPAAINNCMLYINNGISARDMPSLKSRPRGNANFDALNFAGININLVKSIDMVFTTTWGEVYCYYYSGRQAIVEAVKEFLKWNPGSKGVVPMPVKVHCFTSDLASIIIDRLRSLFDNLSNTFFGAKYADDARYIFNIEGSYAICQMRDEQISVDIADDMPTLLRTLAETQSCFSPVTIDPYSLNNSYLPTIYAQNQPGKFQLFVLEKGNQNYLVTILDENGSLQSQHFHNISIKTILCQYTSFFRTTFAKLELAQTGDALREADEHLEYFRLIPDTQGQMRLENLPTCGDIECQYLPISAHIDLVDQSSRIYNIFVGNDDFSSLEYGRDLFREVARAVISQRREGNLPIFFNSIDLSPALLAREVQDKTVQSQHFLKYKRWLEDQINTAINELNNSNRAE